MGFKSKLNKMKSFLFDEEEIKEEKKSIKLTKTKKEEKIKNDYSEIDIPEKENLFLEDISEDNFDIDDYKPRSNKVETEFNFPEYDDDDFIVSKPVIEEKPIKQEVKEEPRVVLYQGSKRKEETKRFKPSPIISPIYGLLDKDGKEIKKDKNHEDNSRLKDEVTFDDVRKKAYGVLDEELEDTLKKLSKKTIEEAEKDMEKEELELSRTNSKKEKIISKEDVDDEDEDMLLPNIDFKEIDIDKEKEKTTKKIVEEEYDDEDDDTKEQDLFNLIDTMYSKEGDE